jgi:hypothetical protein
MLLSVLGLSKRENKQQKKKILALTVHNIARAYGSRG